MASSARLATEEAARRKVLTRYLRKIEIGVHEAVVTALGRLEEVHYPGGLDGGHQLRGSEDAVDGRVTALLAVEMSPELPAAIGGWEAFCDFNLAAFLEATERCAVGVVVKIAENEVMRTAFFKGALDDTVAAGFSFTGALKRGFGIVFPEGPAALEVEVKDLETQSRTGTNLDFEQASANGFAVVKIFEIEVGMAGNFMEGQTAKDREAAVGVGALQMRDVRVIETIGAEVLAKFVQICRIANFLNGEEVGLYFKNCAPDRGFLGLGLGVIFAPLSIDAAVHGKIVIQVVRGYAEGLGRGDKGRKEHQPQQGKAPEKSATGLNPWHGAGHPRVPVTWGVNNETRCIGDGESNC